MFLACLLCASQFGMFAQDLTIPMMEMISVIPSVFTIDSKTLIHSYVIDNYNESENLKCVIYNNELEEVASIDYKPLKYLRTQRLSKLVDNVLQDDYVIIDENYDYIDWCEIDVVDLCSNNKMVCHPYGSVILTQTLFNEDEKWEYMVPKYTINQDVSEYDNNYDGIMDTKRISNHIMVTGIDVKSEDGSIVYSLSFDKEYSESDRLTLLLWDDKVYLAVEPTYTSSDLYLVDKKNSSITKAKSLGSMKLYPSLAKKNSSVTVDIDDNTKMNGGILCITDMNGRVVYTRDVKIGESQLQIPIKRLSSGMYVVTLKSGNDSFEATKLIVR